MINLKFVKLFNKYNFYYYNDKKLFFLYSSKDLKDSNNKLKKFIKKKKISKGYFIISSLNITSKKLYQSNKKSELKLIGGPIYVKVQKIKITKINNKVKLVKKNKNKVYFSKKYIYKKYDKKNSWLIKDLNKIVKYFVKNKLKNNLLSVNIFKKI